MKLYLDDIRPTPPEYDTRAYTAEEAIALVETGRVTEISLDNDLGTKLEGYDVAKRIEELAFHNKIPRLRWKVHSANPSARVKMLVALINANIFWSRHEELS